MKKPSNTILKITGALLLVIIIAFTWLNFIYLPMKVKKEGPAFLEQKTKGRIRAKSITYIPFRGVKLKDTALLSRKTKEPVFEIDKVYFNVTLWRLITRQELDFRLQIYPDEKKSPVDIKGFYQINEQKLNLASRITHDFLEKRQTIRATATALINTKEKSYIDLQMSSPGLNIQGDFYIQDKDLYIEKFFGNILTSQFNLIGDAQGLPNPDLNIYGDIDLDLNTLSQINPKYAKNLSELKITGRCPGKIYITSKANNPEIGLKLNAGSIMVEKTRVEGLSLTAKIENKKLLLNQFYAKVYEGEVNLEGRCSLDEKGLPVDLNVNVFNLQLNQAIRDYVEKDIPVHGRLFCLGKLRAPLKDTRAVEGDLWVSVSGSNILQLPVFKGMTDVLRLPQMRKTEFKEASGNFTVGGEKIRTDDFKVVSNNVVIYFDGYMDFAGNLEFNIRPAFATDFFSDSEEVQSILKIFTDQSGKFMGELKMKGNIKSPQYTFKPIAVNNIIPRAIEEGLKQLFKLKNK